MLQAAGGAVTGTGETEALSEQRRWAGSEICGPAIVSRVCSKPDASSAFVGWAVHLLLKWAVNLDLDCLLGSPKALMLHCAI